MTRKEELIAKWQAAQGKPTSTLTMEEMAGKYLEIYDHPASQVSIDIRNTVREGSDGHRWWLSVIDLIAHAERAEHPVRRPDTGRRRNMIIEMAASILADKAEENRMIIDMRREKYGDDDPTARILAADVARIEAAVALMDEKAGCWS